MYSITEEGENQSLEVPTNNSPLQRNNSFRKVLPTTPSTTSDARLSMSRKMIERPEIYTANNNVNKMYQPYLLEYSIMAEFQLLQKQDLPGVYIIPSEQNSLLWFGVIFVRQGLYQGGVFRFNVHIPANYPDGGCPRVIFTNKVFHPAINFETGELNVNEEFFEWKKKMHQIWHVIQYVRRIFYKIDSGSPYNPEAAELFVKDPVTFKEIVKSSVEDSKVEVFNSNSDDPHYIHFEPYNPTLHEAVRDEIAKSTTLDKIRNF